MTVKAACGPGSAILMTGYAGTDLTRLLTPAHREALTGRFPLQMIRRLEAAADAQAQPRKEPRAESSAALCLEIPDGGVFAGLWRIAEETGCGLEVTQSRIPILQETIEIAEFFDVDPYLIRSAGSFLIVAEDPAGIPAARIGRLIAGNDKKVLRPDGGIRYIDKPRGRHLKEI